MTRESADEMGSGGPDSDVGAAVRALHDLTVLLRRECPWDRAQTAGTIVPHTLEEAYEVADVVGAIEAGTETDLGRLEDELGDLLFQVVFLAMLCSEQRAEIDLASVARRIHAKLVSRHPHVFGSAEADTADEVRSTWEQVKQREGASPGGRGLFDGVPEAMPAVTRARKIQQRAGSVGFDFRQPLHALDKLDEEVAELRREIERAAAAGTMPDGESSPPDQRVVHEVGDALFAIVNVARLSRVDPELALRDATRRFRERVDVASSLASGEGVDFAAVDLATQESFYQRAKASLQ